MLVEKINKMFEANELISKLSKEAGCEASTLEKTIEASLSKADSFFAKEGFDLDYNFEGAKEIFLNFYGFDSGYGKRICFSDNKNKISIVVNFGYAKFTEQNIDNLFNVLQDVFSELNLKKD
ncbi:hypothetical protein [Campylobacter sp. RM16188]|uniref:hypothetical protein n=1 Tax=Campylobacter sp. RM16188 TaxID=1705725 RepID=UPI00155749FF|nr:hypothetical protein [Campylobacter sp. RM16188]